MNASTRTMMRDWLIRFHTRSQNGGTFAAGDWAGRNVTDCINELNDAQLQREWESYQC